MTIFSIILVTAGCAPAQTPTPTSTLIASPSPPATPTHQALANPYAYTTPLPPPNPSEIDGVYTFEGEFAGTPTPCRRCAPYRAEGGEWRLALDRGVFRVTHSDTDFQGIGSFTVEGNRLTLFNDPHCHLEVAMYSWQRDDRRLRLKTIDDPCAFGLRAKTLTQGIWLLQSDETGHLVDPCQPPDQEAAITGHWSAPENCK